MVGHGGWFAGDLVMGRLLWFKHGFVCIVDRVSLLTPAWTEVHVVQSISTLRQTTGSGIVDTAVGVGHAVWVIVQQCTYVDTVSNQRYGA